jgi:hypothetical protein
MSYGTKTKTVVLDGRLSHLFTHRHTKNTCNCLFNLLKHGKKNIFTMDELMKALNVSEKITVVPTITSDFLNYDGAFKVLYTDLKGKVKNNHIFTCNGDHNKLFMTI